MPNLGGLQWAPYFVTHHISHSTSRDSYLTYDHDHTKPCITRYCKIFMPRFFSFFAKIILYIYRYFFVAYCKYLQCFICKYITFFNWKCLLKEVAAHVDQDGSVTSIAAEKDLSQAFRELCSVQISLDSIKSLPVKVLSVYLHAKFDDGVLDFVTSSLAALDTLPNSMRKVSLVNLTGLSECEVIVICFLFVAILYAIKRKKFRIQLSLNDVFFFSFTGFSSLRSLLGSSQVEPLSP